MFEESLSYLTRVIKNLFEVLLLFFAFFLPFGVSQMQKFPLLQCPFCPEASTLEAVLAKNLERQERE